MYLNSNVKRRVLPMGSWLSLSLVAIMITGCGSKAPWEKTHAVVGEVKHKGKPVANAELSFFPEDDSFPESVRPKARTDSQGKFVVWTYKQEDGAPEGTYKVTVIHNEVAVSKDTIVAKPNDLPPQYSKRDTTSLKVEVAKGQNVIPAFDLR